MMQAYYDTGALVPLYVKEAFTDAIVNYVESRNEVIPLNLFQQLELENALRLKIFRGEMEDERCQAVLKKIKSNLEEGKLALRPVDWMLAMEAARQLAAQTTGRWGCRTLDLLHVAVAMQWQCAAFVTADDRQFQAARAAGLKTVDVRTLERRDRPDNAESGTPAGAVKEKRVRYGKRKSQLPVGT